MANDKNKYTIPQDSHPTMASEPAVAYLSPSAPDTIILPIPQGVDAEQLREKVNAYYSVLLQESITERQFYNHYQMWIKETGPLSSPRSIATNRHLQEIVKMGKAAVPYIIKELSRQPSLLYLALEQIYNMRLLDPKPLTETSHTTMCSWNPIENTRLWIEKLS